MALWSLYYLPPFDFRPYHIGTNLRQQWQRTMEGEDLPYADFFIESGDGDITEQVLADTGYTFLLVSPYLEQADDSRLDLINQLYEYTQEHDYVFYCLTASSAKQVRVWRDITGAEYPFCQTDGTTLKTVIRSNPGLLLVKDGVIIRKWSHNNLPELSEAETTLPLEQLEIGKLPTDGPARKIATILLWFVLPLALLTMADRLWMWTHWLRRRKKTTTEENLTPKK